MKGNAQLIGAALGILFVAASAPAVLNTVSDSTDFQRSVSTDTEWNLGTLTNLTASNGQIDLDANEKNGKYTSQAFTLDGNLERTAVDATVYDKSSISYTVEVSDDGFSSVKDSKTYSLSNSTDTLTVDLNGDNARVKADFSRQSSTSNIVVDTENEWQQGTLTNLTASGGDARLDAKTQEKGLYTSETFDVSSGIPENGTITATVYNQTTTDLTLTAETSDDGFSSVKDSQSYDVTNSTDTFDLTGFSSANDMRFKLDYSRNYSAETYSADTQTEWQQGTLTNLTASGGTLELSGDNITGTYTSQVYSNSNNYFLEWIDVKYDAQNNDGNAKMTVQTDDNTNFNSPAEYSFNMSDGVNTEQLSNLAGNAYGRVVIDLER